jgi:hypothetical protein
MRISKLIAVAGTLALGTGFTSVHAADTDTAAQAAARAAVIAAMLTDTNAAPVTVQPAAAPVLPAPAPAPVQPVVATPVAIAPVVVTNSTNNAAQAAALAALNQALQTNMVANPPAVMLMTNAPVMTPAAPALPVTASVADRLQALDAQYKANQITPMDYFTQREALLKNQ